MSTSNHPLPTPPGQHQRPTQHRTKTSFSFRSNHSHKSSGSITKIDLHETHQEKESQRLKDSSKADPSVAMNEKQPSEVAKEAKQLPSIRDIQHFDKLGNPIADPDRSNPTRSRWERPLDTIRAFEEAIDGNYSRKSTYMRKGNGADDGASQFNRRSSYYGGTQVTVDERPRNTYTNSYYSGGGGARQSYMPDSYVENKPNGNMRPESYYNNAENVGPSNGYYPNRARYPRTASEPHYNNGQGAYPVTGNQHPFDTVPSASGSGSSPDTIGYSTDPSSENSSVDRIAHMTQHEPTENYGFDGFGQNPQIQPPGEGLPSIQRQGNGYPSDIPPAVPQKEMQVPRVPMKLTAGNGGPARQLAEEKRKSWFGKRFSKHS